MEQPLNITKNDRAIFSVLQEFPCLSLPFIAELVGKKPRIYPQPPRKPIVRYPHLRARLQELRETGYLEIVEAVRPHLGQKNRHNVYAITAKARKLVAPANHSMRRSNNPHHDLGSCFIAASFKLGVQADSRLRFITPQELLDHQYCPDATRQADYPFSIPVRYWHGKTYVETFKKHDWRPFGIAFKGANEKEKRILFSGIEYDRDSEGSESADPERSSIERHLRMILALLEDGYKAHFGTRQFFVPIVTTSQRRMEAMQRLLLDLTDGKGAERILFQVMPDWTLVEAFPKADGHMLTQKWHRAGYSDFDIIDAIDTKEKAA